MPSGEIVPAPDEAVYLVTDKRQLATPAEIQATEEALGAPLPPAYIAFVTRRGAGCCDGYLRIYEPARVVAERAFTQDLFRHHAYFWKAGAAVLSQERVPGLIAIGDTIDADYLTYHPEESTQLYLLPRHDDHIHAIGPRLEDAWAWLAGSGVTAVSVPKWEYVAGGWRPAPAFHAFESNRDRAETSHLVGESPQSLKAVRERLIAMARSEEGARLIRYGEDDPRGQPAVQELFLPRARAVVHCQGYEDGAALVTISYDPMEVHPILDVLVAFLESMGGQRVGEASPPR